MVDGLTIWPMPNELLSDVVAGEVRSWLGRRGYKQKDLASALGIDPSAISERLNGKTDFTLDELPAVAEFLDIDLEELVRVPTSHRVVAWQPPHNPLAPKFISRRPRAEWALRGSNPQPTDYWSGVERRQRQRRLTRFPRHDRREILAREAA